MREKKCFGYEQKIQDNSKKKKNVKMQSFNSHSSYYMLKMCNAVSNRAESFWKLLRSIVGPSAAQSLI